MMYKKFILALAEAKYDWVINCIIDDFSIIEISCEFSDDMTIGECKKIAKETVEIFTKKGFDVDYSYDSRINHPVLEIKISN